MARILVLHWGRTAAGPALALKLTQELIDDGRHDVAVSCSAEADIVDGFRQLVCPRLEVSTWSGSRGVPLALARLPLTIWRLRRFMHRHRITTTIVVMEQPLQSFAARAFTSGGARYVHFMHDALLHPGEQSRIMTLLRRQHLRPSDEVVVFSEAVHAAALSHWGLAGDRVHLSELPPLFTTSQAAAPRSLPAGHPVVCGMFGRAVEYKGFDLAVDAVAELRRTGLDLRLRLVAKGVSALIPARHQGADWLEVEDRWLADDEITTVMGGFDILLLPYREASQSGVLVEAAALGIPCVVTPVGGLPEQALGLGCGCVAESVDVEGVARAIAEIATAPARYAKISRDSIDRAAGDRGWKRLLEDLEPLLV